jgi:hypothetical protein
MACGEFAELGVLHRQVGQIEHMLRQSLVAGEG